MLSTAVLRKVRYGVELRRSRRVLVGGAIFLASGVFVLLCVSAGGSSPSIGARIFGGLVVLMGGALVLHELRPFRFHIGVEGLTLRVAGINRLVPWAEIDVIILDQPPPKIGGNRSKSPSLLLVPAGSTIDRPLTGRSPVDGRPALALLDLDDVLQSPAEVAAALARFGGSRFTDMRERRRQRFDSPGFTVMLRGYDQARVDDLIRQGQEALISDRSVQRHKAKAELEAARTALPVGMRGYDCQQVDAFLEELSASLASIGEDEQDASSGKP
jgi:DivIVA domain-containing protein